MPDCITKIDHAGSRDAVSLLAHFLYAEAGVESVRTREGITAAIANQVERLPSGTAEPERRSRRTARFIECLERLGAVEAAAKRTDDRAFASCRRIAQRAVSGALQDPTGGAVRFHEFGRRPGWATGLNPSAWIGSYLFYRDDAHGEAPPALEASSKEAF